MKHWVHGRLSIVSLAVSVMVAVGGLTAVERTAHRVPHPEQGRQIEAARLMAAALAEVKQLRLSLGIPIDPELDPNGTGMIGEEFTELTTSLGDLQAKRTTTNPAFAALMVKYFSAAGLKAGDAVAIGASGSFPSLLIATLAACKTMELRPIIIGSLGASMYGANLPPLTVVPMLQRLKDAGLLPYRLAAVSMGGQDDRAEGMFFKTSQETIRGIAESAGVPFIHERTIAESVRRRMQVYSRASGGRPPKCFVNIGGATPNYGNTPWTQRFPNGLVLRAPVTTSDPERGLIFEYATRGIPVINLIDVKGLALKNGISFDPVPIPPIGRDGVYYVSHRDWKPALAALLIAGALLLPGIRAGAMSRS